MKNLFERTLYPLSGMLLIVGTILIFINVVLRKAFNEPWGGTEELSSILLMCIVYLPLAIVELNNKQLNLSVAYDLFPPKVQFWCRKLQQVVILGVYIYLTSGTWELVMKNFQEDNTTLVMRLPIYLIYSVMLVSFGITILVKIYQIFKSEEKRSIPMISALIFIGTLVLGFPIYIALLLCGMYILVFTMGMGAPGIVLMLYDGVAKFTLAAVPFFLLAGAILDNTTMGRRLVTWLFSMVRQVRGGLPISGVMASEFFGALSGSASASTGTVGKILYPQISKSEGDSFALGLLTSCGALAVIMPPSISMILYGATANVSTGTLFLTGIVPALIIGLLLVTFIVWRSKKRDRPEERFSFKEFILNTKNAFWVLILPIIILGGIYSGLFTPTEAASVAAMYALVVAVFIYREMSFKSFYNSIKDTLMLTSQIFIVIAASVVFSHSIMLAQVPQQLAVLTEGLSPFMFILLLNISLLIIGMFLDTASAILVVTPLMLPICMNLGIDPLHLGIMMVVNLAIGLFTPPFGLNLFVSQSVFNKSMKDVVIGLKPFWIWYFIALALISYIPQLYMWIPELLRR